MESVWGPTNVNNKPEEYSSSKEREARSIALEKAYVHDVYQQIASHFSDARYRAWPKVKQFLLELEPGSVVCDVGKSISFLFSSKGTLVLSPTTSITYIFLHTQTHTPV